MRIPMMEYQSYTRLPWNWILYFTGLPKKAGYGYTTLCTYFNFQGKKSSIVIYLTISYLINYPC